MVSKITLRPQNTYSPVKITSPKETTPTDSQAYAQKNGVFKTNLTFFHNIHNGKINNTNIEKYPPLEQAIYFHIKGNYNTSIRILNNNKIIEPLKNYYLARNLIKTGKYQQSIDLLKKTLDTTIDHNFKSKMYRSLAVAYFANGQKNLCFLAYKTSLNLNPKNNGSSHSLGFLYLQKYHSTGESADWNNSKKYYSQVNLKERITELSAHSKKYYDLIMLRKSFFSTYETFSIKNVLKFITNLTFAKKLETADLLWKSIVKYVPDDNNLTYNLKQGDCDKYAMYMFEILYSLDIAPQLIITTEGINTKHTLTLAYCRDNNTYYLLDINKKIKSASKKDTLLKNFKNYVIITSDKNGNILSQKHYK